MNFVLWTSLTLWTFITVAASHDADLCETDEKISLECPPSSYIHISSVELTAGCLLAANSRCSLISRITRGSLLSDQCNWYNLKVREHCQGSSTCQLSFSLLGEPAQAVSKAACNPELNKALTVQYVCLTEQAESYHQLLDRCMRNTKEAQEAVAGIFLHTMTRVDALAPTTDSSLNISRHSGHAQTDLTKPSEFSHSISIILITTILLAVLLLIGLLTLSVVCICRRRKSKEKQGKRRYPSLPPGMSSEFDFMDGIHHGGSDVLFDQKKFNSFSRKNKKSDRRFDEKCQSCLDRGHLVCQGHSLSRSSSFGAKDKKNLTFLIPSGYYEHVKDTTDQPVREDVHMYSKLSDAYALPSNHEQIAPDTGNVYGHLHLATSGKPQEQAESEYDVPANYYEEMPDGIVPPEPADKQEEGDAELIYDNAMAAQP